MKSLTLQPRLSEKAYGQSVAQNVYVFVVPTSVNKHTIASAVEAQFGVTVTNVRTMIQNGKAITSRSKRTRGVTVTRKDTKKAYVTIKLGDHIAIFDAPEDKKSVKKEATTSAKKEKK
ncbi:50S ribosomal protein L23 [Candidatus Saccharibacteria bacterium]|nr:50S ribosomal protein L23 [Candidatus Saccharibacteria bacterium]